MRVALSGGAGFLGSHLCETLLARDDARFVLGRVVSSFITQALNGDPLTCYGDGTQTRSFCYADLVRGIVAMFDADETGPINLGNPAEVTIAELAEIVLRVTGSDSPVGGQLDGAVVASR